jgi:outer membrane protein assembly factor BamD
MRRTLLASLFLLLSLSLFPQSGFPEGGPPPDKRGENQPTELKAALKRNKFSPTENMNKADKYFAKKRYNRAAQFYQQVTFERNSPLVSSAQFQLAECYFQLKRYAEARTEYEVITRQFIDHPKRDKAYFQIGVCWYEESLPAQYTQEETQLTIAAFGDYLERYPGLNAEDETRANEYIQKCQYKLVLKKYCNGYIYYRMEDYSSALLYFNEVRQTGLNDRIDRLSMYYSARIYLKRKDLSNARAVIAELEQRYPSSKEARRLKKHQG